MQFMEDTTQPKRKKKDCRIGMEERVAVWDKKKSGKAAAINTCAVRNGFNTFLNKAKTQLPASTLNMGRKRRTGNQGSGITESADYHLFQAC